MPTDWRAVASSQHGAITRAQLLASGLGRGAINYRLESGALEIAYPAVYLVPEAPRTWDQALFAAFLAAGPTAVISHLAAGKYWQLEDVVCDRPELLITHARRIELPGVVVHRTRCVSADEVTSRKGLRLTKPARTLVDLAALLHRDPLERALDDALRRRIVAPAQVRRSLDARGPNGVHGWATMNELVEERVGTQPTGSGKETKFLRGLRERRMPIPIKQYRILDADGRFVAKPEELRIAIEIDSGFHANPRRRRVDLRRQNAMVLAGWRPLYFDNGDATSQLEAFAAIEAAFAAFGESKS